MAKVHGLIYDSEKNEVRSSDAIFEDGKFVGYDESIVNVDSSINVAPSVLSTLRRRDKIAVINGMLRDGELIMERCKDCNKFYILNKDEISWYEEKGMKAPTRCNGCREWRKNNNNANKKGEKA